METKKREIYLKTQPIKEAFKAFQKTEKSLFLYLLLH
jgi:hypothetical protein